MWQVSSTSRGLSHRCCRPGGGPPSGASCRRIDGDLHALLKSMGKKAWRIAYAPDYHDMPKQFDLPDWKLMHWQQQDTFRGCPSSTGQESGASLYIRGK